MSPVDFKNAPCRSVESKKWQCRPVDFRGLDPYKDKDIKKIIQIRIQLFRDGMPSLSSSYNIFGLVPVCWLLFQCFVLKPAKIPKS